jgi:hypothetical protein
VVLATLVVVPVVLVVLLVRLVGAVMPAILLSIAAASLAERAQLR